LKNNKGFRGVIIFVLILLAAFAFARLMGQGDMGGQEELSYNQFIEKVKADEVSRINVMETQLVGLYRGTEVDEKKFPADYDFIVTITPYLDVQEDLTRIAADRAEKLGQNPDTVTSTDLGIVIDYQLEKSESWITMLIPYFVLLAIIGIMLFLFMRQVQGTNNKAMSFGKSKARVVDPTKRKVTFDNVAGADEEKEELREIVDFLKNPKKFMDIGARIPKGVLLMGPPGTGKTLLARAVAGEAGVPFLTISGSDFVEMYVGVGASRVRDLFDQAKKNAPSIIFIDEIDAVGRHRGSGLGGGHDEREQTLNQLLVEMDGFTVNEGIIIIAATNRPDILDPALLRPGRFDRQVTVSYPDVKGREEILAVHAKGKPFAKDVNLGTIAKLTPFFTGADLENVLNEAAILTARADKREITMDEITEAIDRVLMGPEKKSRKVIEKDRRLVAYHEAGHAIVANALPNCDPVHIVTIVPRGQAGGYTQTLPVEESWFIPKAKLLDNIAMSLGGYMAESIVFGDISTGSSSDLKHATESARKMITEFGMSEDVGPVYLAGEKELMIGREIGHTRNYSEKLSAMIDNEISHIIETSRKKAEDILKANRDKLEKVVDVLLKREKISGDDFRAIMDGTYVDPMEEASAAVAEPKADESAKVEKSGEVKPKAEKKTASGGKTTAKKPDEKKDKPPRY